MDNTIRLEAIGTYETGIFDESAAEINAFDPTNNRLFVVNAENVTIDVLDLSDPTNPTQIATIDVNSFGGVANSVAVENGIVAVAVEDNNAQADGQVVFFDASGDFTTALNSVTVGPLPDMVTFTPDGNKLLVANEGEPNDDYTVDPEGSISIIDISGGVENPTVTTADFTGFNDQQQQLIDSGVRIFGPNATVAQDLEPEFIAISEDGQTAFVTLQENNAIAVVDIESATVDEILPLGFQDYSIDNTLDASDRDGGINLQNFPVFGLFQPDAISAFDIDGQTYYITANEGDARDFDGFSEEVRVEDLDLDPEAFPNAEELQQEEALGRLQVTNTLGDTDGDGDFDQLFAFGGRSFSIWDEFGNLVFDSGDDFETITAELLPEAFNSEGTVDSFDNRSDNRGPEPEGVVTGEIDGRTYAFIGLERIGGVMVYDVSDPTSPDFVQYINNNDINGDPEAGTAGDIGPEGLTFIAAEDSPNGEPLLVVSNEVSGTTTIFNITTPIDTEIFGTDGDDILEADTDRDVFGLRGNDILDASTGGGGNRLFGNEGDDLLFAGNNDRLGGDKGNDILDGSAGSGNRLFGDEGDDILFLGSNGGSSGWTGDDLFFVTSGGGNFITGDAGADQFWVANGELPDAPNTVTDFELGVDAIGIGGFTQDEITFDQNRRGDAILEIGGTDVAIFLGVTQSELQSATFLFG